MPKQDPRPVGGVIRQACDSCHAKKIKCIRSISRDSCERCVRESMVCVFSPALKTGRPRKDKGLATPTPPPPGDDHAASGDSSGGRQGGSGVTAEASSGVPGPGPDATMPTPTPVPVPMSLPTTPFIDATNAAAFADLHHPDSTTHHSYTMGFQHHSTEYGEAVRETPEYYQSYRHGNEHEGPNGDDDETPLKDLLPTSGSQHDIQNLVLLKMERLLDLQSQLIDKRRALAAPFSVLSTYTQQQQQQQQSQQQQEQLQQRCRQTGQALLRNGALDELIGLAYKTAHAHHWLMHAAVSFSAWHRRMVHSMADDTVLATIVVPAMLVLDIVAEVVMLVSAPAYGAHAQHSMMTADVLQSMQNLANPSLFANVAPSIGQPPHQNSHLFDQATDLNYDLMNMGVNDPTGISRSNTPSGSAAHAGSSGAASTSSSSCSSGGGTRSHPPITSEYVLFDVVQEQLDKCREAYDAVTALFPNRLSHATQQAQAQQQQPHGGAQRAIDALLSQYAAKIHDVQRDLVRIGMQWGQGTGRRPTRGVHTGTAGE